MEIKMQQNNPPLKTIILSAALVIVVLGAVYYFLSDRQQPGEESGQPWVTRTEVPIDEVPAGFPADLPIEQGAAITSNFSAQASDGRIQDTRAFESAKTVKQNFTLYSDFLTQNGWTITTSSETEMLSSIFATKDSGELAVNISKNILTGKVVVDLSFIH